MLVLQYDFEKEIQTERANPIQCLSIVDLFLLIFHQCKSSALHIF